MPQPIHLTHDGELFTDDIHIGTIIENPDGNLGYQPTLQPGEILSPTTLRTIADLIDTEQTCG